MFGGTQLTELAKIIVRQFEQITDPSCIMLSLIPGSSPA
jgi:hypothetical protein